MLRMEHFADLLEWFSTEARADVKATYKVMGGVLRRVADEQTADCELVFSGLFSQLEFLLAERLAADDAFARRVHDLRGRVGRVATTPVETLEHCMLYDLRTLCELTSRLTDEPIPVDLQKRFPQSLEQSACVVGSVRADYLRVVVQSFDEQFIIARPDGEDSTPIRICYREDDERCSMGDRTYLHALLQRNMQLNIVRPRRVGDADADEAQGGYYVAELIIVEPDYLVDVSAIASCFESYAHSPLLHLLNKLKPSPQSEAIVLGNLASQMLDEELHDADLPRTYRETIGDFFRQNSLAIASMEQWQSDFHGEAQRQQQHIRAAVQRGLTEVSAFQREHCVVEPTFFCELLGIQGRMDLLQDDMKILVEQKSGKSEFPIRPDNIRPQLKHFVQLLLYQAMLHYQFRLRNDEINTFLLYSKYPKGLIKVGAAPAQLFEAVRIRNELVANEFSFALPPQPTAGAVRPFRDLQLLTTLQPSDLRQLAVSDRLWGMYVEPQLRQLLQPIAQATPLERDYFFRFMRFLQTEHLLSKLGNRTKECSGFASAWHATLEEKRMAGNILCPLCIQRLEGEGTSISRVVLSVDDDDEIGAAPNFRLGDIVVLYPYPTDAEPDLRCTPVMRATIAAFEGDRITLMLRAPQTRHFVFETDDRHHWAMEHDFMESAYSSLYRAMHAFLTAPAHRRSLLLAQRPPVSDACQQLQGDYGTFNPLVLQAKQARDIFLVIGPPGTGKTSFAMLNILREHLCDPTTNVLLAAYTHRAVDEICSKLVEHDIPFVRLGQPLSCAEPYRDYLLENQLATCTHIDDVRALISQQRVFVGTTAAFSARASVLLQMKHFSLAIIDEASQLLEPHLLSLLCAATADDAQTPAIDKFVFIGDHKQLPAVVQQTPSQSRVDEPSLRGIGLTDCRHSFFERMLRQGAPCYMLTHQGRMHIDIADFPNRAFYGGRLQPVPLPHQLASADSQRLTFIPSERPQHAPSDKVNPVEADLIARIVADVYHAASSFDPSRTIGVIVPYRNQIQAVRQAIAAHVSDAAPDHPLHRITIDTVERYQGSQREVIVYGFTIQRPYQLRFLTDNVFEEGGMTIDRKLNVVMTRAMYRLYLVGNPALLRLDPVFSQLLDYCGES